MAKRKQPVRPAGDALEIYPLEPARLSDLVALFGERGACGGCWCMYWRLPRAQFERQKGAGNRAALGALVAAGRPVGLIAYARGRAVAWCAVAPREDYPRLERSRTLARVDDRPVWSVTCMFVARPFRRRGVTAELLRAAIDYVRERGGRVVEGYPVEPREGEVPDVFAWTGLAPAFIKAGFRECLRRSETRPIMRYEIGR